MLQVVWSQILSIFSLNLTTVYIFRRIISRYSCLILKYRKQFTYLLHHLLLIVQIIESCSVCKSNISLLSCNFENCISFDCIILYSLYITFFSIYQFLFLSFEFQSFLKDLIWNEELEDMQLNVQVILISFEEINSLVELYVFQLLCDFHWWLLFKVIKH